MYKFAIYMDVHSKFAIPILHCFYSKLHLAPAGTKELTSLHMLAQPAQCSQQQLKFKQPEKLRPDCTT